MYYYFWAVMTATVLFGQIYVGTGYRLLAGRMFELLQKVDGVLLYKPDTKLYSK
jgi:hypothetical protein